MGDAAAAQGACLVGVGFVVRRFASCCGRVQVHMKPANEGNLLGQLRIWFKCAGQGADTGAVSHCLSPAHASILTCQLIY